MIIEKKKPAYIMSLEASDIFCHQHRNLNIKKEYYGMIPFSLELIKLIENGMRTKYLSNRDKYISDDIINVKFKTKTKSVEKQIEDTLKAISSLQESIEKDAYDNKPVNKKKEFAYNAMLEQLIGLQEMQNNPTEVNSLEHNLGEVSLDELRHHLYMNGFKIKFKHPKTGNIKEVEYVVYKRSSAKSRTGQCLFIKKSMFKKMIQWSRMRLPFKNGQEVDLAGLLAYESLVGSSLEDTIKINPYNILIVEDVDSKFKRLANVVSSNEKTGYLDSFREETIVSNSLFDGQSLLDCEFFKDGQSMILLRNHMFKSASFNTNISLFLKDEAKNKGIDYNTWELEDMYGNKMLAKDIKMIITPNSLKALKFKDVLKEKTEKAMWDYWRELVASEGSLFGICKHDKSSKLGKDSDGLLLQQTSYQMINCLPIGKEEISHLTNTESEYIKRLQTDDGYLMQEILRASDETNVNKALADIYCKNRNIVETQIFKNFKKKFIFNKREHAKKGKIKINGDYVVLLGNPLEMLYHSVGYDILNNTKKSIIQNEVHCNLFNDGEELVGFRNPNTSPSNVLHMKNKIVPEINKYFNLSVNIIAVNAIDFEIQDILSGCDYDSDTMLASNDTTLVEIAKKCRENYLVCVNNIKGDKKKYTLSQYDHYEIDKQLSSSQRIIGRVVNLGQLCMSAYWDALNNGKSGEKVDELLKKVDVMTILSGIAIDMAKKFYDIDMMKEIINVQNNSIIKERGKKPNFWIYVSQNKNIGNQLAKFECPMDILMEYINEDKIITPRTRTISFNDIIRDDLTTKRVEKRQIDNINELIIYYDNQVKKIKLENLEDERERILELESIIEEKTKKWKLKAETMSVILKEGVFKEKFSLRLIKVLHSYHKDELLKVFKEEIG